MVQQNEEVNYQGRRGRVTSVQGEPPNQILNIRFDDGTERIVTLGEIENASGAGERGKPLNDKQIGRGQSGGGAIRPPMPDNTLPSQGRLDRPNQDLPDYGKPKPTPYSNKNPEYQSGMRTDSRADEVKPPLGGDEGNPPEYGIDADADATPNDLGPGTGDSGAGLKADGKDVDSPRRRLLGTEEIVVYIEPVTRKVVDRNGRKLEVGTTISIKARLIKFHGADKVEVLYPPYVKQSDIPVWSSERNRLEIANQDDPSIGNGVAYEGTYRYDNGQIVDANGQEAPQFEPEKQEKLTISTKYIEKF